MTSVSTMATSIGGDDVVHFGISRRAFRANSDSDKRDNHRIATVEQKDSRVSSHAEEKEEKLDTETVSTSVPESDGVTVGTFSNWDDEDDVDLDSQDGSDLLKHRKTKAAGAMIQAIVRGGSIGDEDYRRISESG